MKLFVSFVILTCLLSAGALARWGGSAMMTGHSGSGQIIASVPYAPDPGSCATGAANTCTTVSAVMRPAAPSFAADGGMYSIVTSAPSGACPGSDFDTNFSINATNGILAINNTSVAAGTYYPCVQASVTPSGLPVVVRTHLGGVSAGQGTQECVWNFTPAITPGDTVVGYTHTADSTDSTAMYPQSVTDNAGNTYKVTPAQSWISFPEDITFWYLTNIQGSPTSLTFNYKQYSYSDSTELAFCDIQWAEYANAQTVTVVNPSATTSTTPSVTISPTSQALLWVFGAIFGTDAQTEDALQNVGYSILLNDTGDNIEIWGSNAIVNSAPVTLNFANPEGSSGYNAVVGAVALQGASGPPTITGVMLSNSGFTTGSSGTVGTLSATLSSGSPTGTFSLTNSGTDHAGTTCNNYSSYLSVSGSKLNFNSSAPAQSYPGTCITYTQSGISDSPYTQAFTLTGSSSGSASCGSAPDGAAASLVSAAGFNTCALYSDFTTAIPNTVGTGLPVVGSDPLGISSSGTSQSGNWMDCNYSDGSTSSIWYWNVYYEDNASCTYITQQTDPLIGKLSLNITLPGSDNQSGNSGAEWTISNGPYETNGTVPAGQIPIRGGFYAEITFHFDPSTENSNAFFNWWMTQNANLGTYSCMISGLNTVQEIDFIEFDNTNPLADIGGISGGSGCVNGWYANGISPYPVTESDSSWWNQENTLGELLTNDGSSNYAICLFYNGTNIYCSGEYPGNPGYAQALTALQVEMQGYENGNPAEFWIEDMKIWSCAGWKTSESCGGTYNSTDQIFTGAN